MAPFTVTLIADRADNVHGHAAGCADLTKRGKYPNAAWQVEHGTVKVATKAEAFADYNEDFIFEGGIENAYPIKWFPCAKHVPEGDIADHFTEDELHP